VVRRAYVPDAGDLVWLTFDPHAGLVKGYPFEVGLPADDTIAGVVLADHVQTAVHGEGHR
jgi:mRNA-degrading endonuclease toxin of MazEF toxin-antitoxin module